ncbi:MAG: glycogen debranching protein GlgX, partial [Myxococcota bacterium]
MQVKATSTFPLGAHFDGAGTRFAVFSGPAERVELCLFDDQDRETRFSLPGREGDVWSGYLDGVRPGQRYGYRVHGPYDPSTGQRCNPHKLLVDPYALAVDGQLDWQPAVFPYPFDQPESAQLEDSARFVPKSVVVSPWFDWGPDQAPRTPWSDTVVLELHVKAATANHPKVPPGLRGTYAGLAHPAFVEHLLRLGVTAVELLPVHQFVHSKSLLDRGLRNHWGYDSLAFFAPHAEYSAHGSRGQQVPEFKHMVKKLHQAGIEVWLDVVYNHTCEGNHLGPILSLKGFDNPSYYRLVEEDRRYYMDYTGCGNTTDSRSPYALQLIVDSLRYWVTEMHVDGFRFDLATALARELHGYDPLGGFLDVLQQDPVLRQAKLVAEPWDVGEGGYQVGGFPSHWSEWNGPFRDDMRDFWRGDEGKLGAFAQRFMGSA